MNAKIFLIPAVISIMGITNLSAQIETYEKPKEKPVEHEWDKYAPYLKNTKDAIETNKWWQDQEHNAKLAAQDAAYKQECIRTFGQRYGTLVYQGKVEIGMTMAMCEEVYKYYSVQAKEETQTASGMRTTIIYKSGRTHIKLVFLNNKLTSKATY